MKNSINKLVMIGALIAYMPLMASIGLGGESFQLIRSTIDGGGATETANAGFEVSGTIGQADTGSAVGGDFELSGGFWFSTSASDCDFDGTVSLFDLVDFEECRSGPNVPPAETGCACFDADDDGDVDLIDYSQLQIGFTGS